MSIKKTVRHFKSSLHVLLMSLWKLPAPVFGGNAPNSSTDAVFRDVLPAAKFMAAVCSRRFPWQQKPTFSPELCICRSASCGPAEFLGSAPADLCCMFGRKESRRPWRPTSPWLSSNIWVVCWWSTGGTATSARRPSASSSSTGAYASAPCRYEDVCSEHVRKHFSLICFLSLLSPWHTHTPQHSWSLPMSRSDPRDSPLHGRRPLMAARLRMSQISSSCSCNLSGWSPCGRGWPSDSSAAFSWWVSSGCCGGGRTGFKSNVQKSKVLCLCFWFFCDFCSLILSSFPPQAVFSSVFYFASVPLYQGFLIIGWDEGSRWLISEAFGVLAPPAFPLRLKASLKFKTGGKNLNLCWVVHMCSSTDLYFVCCSYSTVYTMFPVFSLVLDKDVKSEVAMLYPELYKDLLKVCRMLMLACRRLQSVHRSASPPTGPTAELQDLLNMGLNKYLSR